MFHSQFSRDPDKAIRLLSLTDYREFYASDSRFAQLINDYPSTETCPNSHPRQTEGAFCPICGARFAIDKVIERLLADDIGKLDVTEFQEKSLRTVFNAHTVKGVLAMTESRLQEAKWIGPVRARQILNAAEEYISG